MTENEKRIGIAAAVLGIGGIVFAAMSSKGRARFRGFGKRMAGGFGRARAYFRSRPWRKFRFRRGRR